MTIKYLDSKRISGLATERAGVSITGGTETTSGSSTIRTFTSTGTLVTGSSMTVQYLVVGGGGSGEQGGGGAGAVRQATGFTLPAGSYTITVGAGAGVGGNIGGDSTFHTITSNGGGDGNNNNSYTGNGSGGGGYGGGGGSNTGASGGTYGNDGGDSSTNLHGAGGGGAGAVGQDYSGGEGGAGTQNLIVGSTIGELSGGNYYIGGGGGGAGSGQNSDGGLGGGGDGKDWYPTAGDANTGGGSGGSYNSGQAGGGSGVVIIKYTTGDGEASAIGTDIQDNSIFVETDTARRYWLSGSTWTMQPTWGDDFSTDNWTHNDSSKTSVSGGKFNWEVELDNSDDTAYRSLGITLGTKFVIRFKYTTDTLTLASNPGAYGKFVVSSSNGGESSSFDWIGIERYFGTASNTWYLSYGDNTSGMTSYTQFSTTPSAGTTYYVEIIRDGATVTGNIYSDDSYSTLVESINITTTGTIENLSFFKFYNRSNNSNTSQTMTGSLDDLKVYNGVTSV